MSLYEDRTNPCDHNLGLLTELIRKDPESYKDDFTEQLKHYLQTVKILHLQPMQHKADLVDLLELINFISNVSSFYPDEAKQFSASMLEVLRSQAAGLNPEIRIAFCKALVILRNRKLVDETELLELFFELVKCSDKQLRKFVYGSMIAQLRRLKHGKCDRRLLGRLESFLFSRLKDSRSIVVRVAELVLINAFRKGLLKDGKTANAISECCFHRLPRIQIAAMRFFLGSLKDEEGFDDDSESDDEEAVNQEDTKTLKEATVAYRAAKKTRKNLKNFQKAKKLINKEKKSKKEERSKFCNLLAIQSLFDPHAFAERLFNMLAGGKNEKFELRILRIALCARVIGVHKLQNLSFYSYLHRYLQPKQREVTRFLLYAAQACHELVPPDIVEQLVRVIAQNFVTDRNSPEAMTVGLNAIREIFVNCPFAANEDLLRDLTEYKKYKNKNVSMAAKGLITLFRTVNPKLLYRKDRGRPSQATKEIEVAEFGKQQTKSFVPGAECLAAEEAEGPSDSFAKNEDEEGSESSWIDMSDSDNEEETDDGNEGANSLEIGQENDKQATNEDNEGGEVVTKKTIGSRDDAQDSAETEDRNKLEEDDTLSAVDKAKMISESRILTENDFHKIRVFQLKKQITPGKKTLGQKRKLDDVRLEEEWEEKMMRLNEGDGLPRLKDIELFHKKIRQTKEERMKQAEAGRTDRESFKKQKKGPHVGRTNREMAKRKNFQMVRQKVRGKNRQRSFRDQQNSLRKYLLRQAGRKV